MASQWLAKYEQQQEFIIWTESVDNNAAPSDADPSNVYRSHRRPEGSHSDPVDPPQRKPKDNPSDPVASKDNYIDIKHNENNNDPVASIYNATDGQQNDNGNNDTTPDNAHT